MLLLDLRARVLAAAKEAAGLRLMTMTSGNFFVAVVKSCCRFETSGRGRISTTKSSRLGTA